MCVIYFLSRCSSYDEDVGSNSEIPNSSSCSSYIVSEEETMALSKLDCVSSSLGDDLEELKDCVDLGFVFNYEEIPEFCTPSVF
ncbi:hypothetical protein BRARA_F02836 [Brassica rapa]|uniref:Uncharacterized protein n=1 Tax=Brassica campestris TaxID=3711 RepID=A0A397Z1Z9_BRACM|nr:hypothetical protein BRARA_F02836 [Brassica rapa]